MTPEAAPAPAQDAPSPSLTPDQATSKLESLLEGQGRPGKPDDEEPGTGQPGDQEPPVEPSEGQEEPSETEEPEEEGEGDEPDQAVEGEEAAGKEPMVELDLDGQSVQMPLSEVTKGYMRQRDYTRKMQHIAEGRAHLEAELEAVTGERQRYAVLIPAMEQGLRQLMPQEPNWQHLMATDVGQYWVERARWEEHMRHQNALTAEQRNVQELQQLDLVQKLQGHLDRSRSWLVEQLPAWRDEKRAKSDKDALRVYAKKTGFSDTEIDQAYDPRLVMWGIKAMKYDNLIANKPKPREEAGPDVLRPGAPVTHSTSREAKVNKAKRRLAQTGRPDDAVAAIEAILSR
jgi:hypothetical protein